MSIRERLIWAFAGGCLTFAGMLAGQLGPSRAVAQAGSHEAEFDRIACKSLVVLDPAGRPAVSVMPTESGGMVALFGSNGASRVVLAGDDTGGTVVVSDASGNGRAAMRVDGQSGVLLVLGSDGAKRVVLGTGPNGGELSVYGNDGKLRGGVMTLRNGAAMTTLGSDGKKRVVMAVDANGNGSVQTFGNDGRRTGSLPSSDFDLR